MRTANFCKGTSGMIGRGFLAGFLGAALLFGAAPALQAEESVEELTAQLAEEEKAAPGSLNVANVLGRLADAHRAAGEFDKAEPLYRRAISIYEKLDGAEAVGVAVMANNLAQAYADRKQYDKAESLYRRAFAICEKTRPEHADTATVANNLGMLYQQQNKLDQAEAMHRRALAIRDKVLGADSEETAATVRNLMEVYRAQGEDAQIARLRHEYPNVADAADAAEQQPEPDGETAVAEAAENDAAEAAEDDATEAVEDDAAEAAEDDAAGEETGDDAVPGEDEGVEENDETATAEDQEADAESEEAGDTELDN